MTLPLILSGMAALLLLAGSLLMLVAAFRVSVVWGLISLFVPLGLLVFTCVHWAAARLGFLLQLAALPFCVGAVVLFAQQDNREIEALFTSQLAKAGITDFPATATALVSADSTSPLPTEVFQSRLEANQRRFTELEAVFTRLTARRNLLDPKKPEAVRVFNDEVALYTSDIKDAQAEKRAIEALRPPDLSARQ